MSDQNSDLVFQEVDDEVRRERLTALWNTFGKYIIALAVGVVLVVAGREIYSGYRAGIEEANSSAFQKAATESEAADTDGAIAIWEAAVKNMKEGYGALAQMRLAAAYLEADRPENAIAAYDALAADENADAAIAGLARLYAATLIQTVRGDIDDARGRLTVLAVKGRPWYASALEQLAFLDVQTGNEQSALDRFSLLAADSDTPQDIRARATQMRDHLDNKLMANEASEATQTDVETPIEDATTEESTAEDSTAEDSTAEDAGETS